MFAAMLFLRKNRKTFEKVYKMKPTPIAKFEC